MKKEIKNMILELCKDKEGDWKTHIESVVENSIKLAQKLDADKEVVEIAAWLHDIRKLKGKKEYHHINGAKDAERILKDLGYPNNKIKQVYYCILRHSSDKNYPPKTKEEKIVASADALCHFDNFLQLSKRHLEKDSLDEAKKNILKKYSNCWNKMMPEAKEMVKKKYKAIKLILT